eukprot:COSAG05_NODE_917_length_6593_cov_8.024484_5_plen_125_part_00
MLCAGKIFDIVGGDAGVPSGAFLVLSGTMLAIAASNSLCTPCDPTILAGAAFLHGIANGTFRYVACCDPYTGVGTCVLCQFWLHGLCAVLAQIGRCFDYILPKLQHRLSRPCTFAVAPAATLRP